jgi:hypothetical protein
MQAGAARHYAPSFPTQATRLQSIQYVTNGSLSSSVSLAVQATRLKLEQCMRRATGSRSHIILLALTPPHVHFPLAGPSLSDRLAMAICYQIGSPHPSRRVPSLWTTRSVERVPGPVDSRRPARARRSGPRAEIWWRSGFCVFLLAHAGGPSRSVPPREIFASDYREYRRCNL